MERQDRIDELIKAKIGNLEDEPSGRVWAGVSGAIGNPTASRSNTWILRVAASIAVLAVVGVGYVLLQQSENLPKAMALKEKTKSPRILVVPMDYMGKKDVFLAQTRDTVLPSLPRLPRLQQGPSFAQFEHPMPRNEKSADDSSKSNVRTPFGPGPDPVLPEKVIVQQDVPKQEASPSPSPDGGGLKPVTPLDEKTDEARAMASNTKRSFHVPGREDLTGDNLRHKSGAILGAFTNGANQFLGLDASYAEKQSEDRKMTAFNADFGLFKIKRVKTVKQ